jgi:hypothetical protein
LVPLKRPELALIIIVFKFGQVFSSELFKLLKANCNLALELIVRVSKLSFLNEYYFISSTLSGIINSLSFFVGRYI